MLYINGKSVQNMFRIGNLQYNTDDNKIRLQFCGDIEDNMALYDKSHRIFIQIRHAV